MATRNNPLFNGGLPAPDPQSRDRDEMEFFAQPQPAADRPHGHDEAAAIIRGKLDTLYAKEPHARHELAAARADGTPSKHQRFMLDLSASGKSLADIQTEWHHYYQNLPDDEKHAVWQEFYSTHNQAKAAQAQPTPADGRNTAAPAAGSGVTVSHHETFPKVPLADRRAASTIQQQVRGLARSEGKKKLTVKHHLHALAFGLAAGGLALLVTLFSFFNEVVIAPFIQPGRSASSTPIIIGTGEAVASGEPKIIIPKINVEIPLDFQATSTDSATIEAALDRGVVHYPITALPGEKGNAAFFGHSSNNLFNKGKYKFAFVLLRQLVPGDTFYLTYGGQVYSYQVFDKKVVPPTQVDVVNPVPGQESTATLITCDPPGTSLNRLVVWGKQVSPDPSKNVASNQQPVGSAGTGSTSSTAGGAAGNSDSLPGNGPTLWRRMINWFGSLF